MRWLLFSILLFLVLTQNIAQNIDHFYSNYELKDGSVYTGYISHQSLTGKFVTITATSAVIVMNETDVNIDTILSITPVSLLEDEMRTLLTKRPHILPNPSNPTVAVVDIEDCKKQYIYHNAVLLQRGEKVKFLTCEDDSISIPIDNIVQVTKLPRPADFSYGINERIETKRYVGDIEGQIVNQNLNNGTIDILSKNEYLYRIKSSDIISRSEVPIDSALPYSMQCPFTETVHTNDKTYCGYIIRQVYGTKDQPGLLFIQTDNNQEERINYSDIRDIYRKRNDHLSVFSADD